MTFSDIVEGRRIMNYYAMANKYGLRTEKIDIYDLDGPLDIFQDYKNHP